MAAETEVEPCEALNLVVSDPRTLVLMLASPEAAVCGQACEALVAYADQGAKQKHEIIKLGALPSLKALLVNKTPSIKKNAALCMSTLTESSEVRKEVRRAKAIEPLVQLLDPEEDSEVHENASLALANVRW